MQDHVDKIVTQWNTEMPNIDASSMLVFGRMYRLIIQLEKNRNKALKLFNFKDGEFDVLATIRRSGQPFEISPTELYQSLLITSGTITHRLNRLEKAGLIYRKIDAKDRRSILVGLTEMGRTNIDKAIVIHCEVQDSFLANLTDAEKTQLATLLKTMSQNIVNL